LWVGEYHGVGVELGDGEVVEEVVDYGEVGVHCLNNNDKIITISYSRYAKIIKKQAKI